MCKTCDECKEITAEQCPECLAWIEDNEWIKFTEYWGEQPETITECPHCGAKR